MIFCIRVMTIAPSLVSVQSLISNQILKSINLVGQIALNLSNSSKILPPPSFCYAVGVTL